jgi:hypothetical protein
MSYIGIIRTLNPKGLCHLTPKPPLGGLGVRQHVAAYKVKILSQGILVRIRAVASM